MITRDQVTRKLFNPGHTGDEEKMKSPSKQLPHKEKMKSPSKPLPHKEKMKSPSKPLPRPKRQSGRSALTSRIDLTKLNSAEYEDLICGVDPTLAGENEKLVKERKQVTASKERSNYDACLRVVATTNVYNSDSEASTTSDNPSNQQSVVPSHGVHDEGIPAKDLNNNSGDKCEGTSAAGGERQNHDDATVTSNVNFSSILQGTSVDIDSTQPLWVNVSTQTDELYFAKCGRKDCSDVLMDIEHVLHRHNKSQAEMSNASDLSTVLHSEEVTLSVEKSSVKKVNEKGENMVTLVKGCPQVMIPLSMKAAIDIAVPDLDPCKLVAYLLDILYNVEEMANMTCDGKTAGTVRLPQDVAAILMVYVTNKYNKKKYNFNRNLFKVFVNEKFYAARRYVWKHRPELVGSGVRAKMAKNVRSSENSTKKIGSKRFSVGSCERSRLQGESRSDRKGDARRQKEKILGRRLEKNVQNTSPLKKQAGTRKIPRTTYATKDVSSPECSRKRDRDHKKGRDHKQRPKSQKRSENSFFTSSPLIKGNKRPTFWDLDKSPSIVKPATSTVRKGNKRPRFTDFTSVVNEYSRGRQDHGDSESEESDDDETREDLSSSASETF